MSPSLELPQRVRARLDPAERYGLRLTLFGAALLIVAVPFATLTFEVLGRGALTRADGRIANSLNHRVATRPDVVHLMEAVSWLGRPPLLALWVLAAATWAWRDHRRRTAIFLVVTSLGGGIVDTVVKQLVDRPRPLVDHPVATALGKSFPSGHAMSSTVTYGALLVAASPALSRRARRLAGIATVALVLAVGCSRLVLGVHFVSDVIGGYLLGLAWLAGATAAFETWRHEAWREDVVEVIQEAAAPDPTTRHDPSPTPRPPRSSP